MVFQRKKILERLTLSPVPCLIYFCKKALPYSFLQDKSTPPQDCVYTPAWLDTFLSMIPIMLLAGPCAYPFLSYSCLYINAFPLASSYYLYLQDLQDPPGLLTFPSQRQFSFDVQISCYTIIIFVSYSFSCLKYSKEYS